MSTWNYRVVYHAPSKYTFGEKEFDREEYLAIHEVYYDEDGNPNSMTINPIVIGDEGKNSLASLKWVLENQLESIKKPILEYELEDNTFLELSQEKQNEFGKSLKTKE